MLTRPLIVLVAVSAAALVIAGVIADALIAEEEVQPPVAEIAVGADLITANSAPELRKVSDRSVHASLPDYRLHGTLAGANPGSALIAAEPGAAVLSYRVGEELPGGAVLQAVSARSAVLEFAGERHTLFFADSTATTGGLTPASGTTSLPAYGVRDGEESLPPRKAIAPDAGEALRRSATGPELMPEQRARHEALALDD